MFQFPLFKTALYAMLFKYNSRSFECNFRSSNETGEIKDKECLDYLLTVGKFSKWDLAGQIKFDTLI